MLTALILAAGRSSRMDYSPKANLLYKGKTFLETGVDKIRSAGIDEVYVIVGDNRDEIIARHKSHNIEFIFNDEIDLGQLRSIQVGLENIPDTAEGVLIHMVDTPLINVDTVRSLVEQYKKNRASIVLPVYGNRRGHPVVFPRTLFAELQNAPYETGARKVVWDNAESVSEVHVNDQGILISIDTPVDYTRWCISCETGIGKTATD